MSSSETVLQDARPERPGEFTFTWSIHNYSYCTLEENECLESPAFKVDNLESHCWIVLYPKGQEAPGFLSCYLLGEGSFHVTLSIRKPNGQYKEGSEKMFDDSAACRGYRNFVSLEELKGPDGYLANDILTIRCRIWRTDVVNPTSRQREAHSRIKNSKLNYTWIIPDISVTNRGFENEFKKTIDVTDFLNKKTEIVLQVFELGTLCDGALQFVIKMIEPKKKYFVMVAVNLIDFNGRVAHSVRGEYLFEGSKTTLGDTWKFPLISKKILFLNKQLLLPNNQLTLQCELGLSTGNKLETFEYRESSAINQQSDLRGMWTRNMKQCYEDRKFTDFIIRTPGRQFPVSRTILSAHSEVFDAMFERDMVERRTGMVDIDDLDDDTMSQMLTYVYTSTIDDIDCSAAQKLYSAADKYLITTLKKMCSKFLMGCVNSSNVCDILEFADRYEDQELKALAREVVYDHAKEIISSEKWKKLKETHYSLTSEIITTEMEQRIRIS